MGEVQNKPQEQDLNQLLKVRREKLAALQEKGKDPFQITKYDVTHHSMDVKEQFEALGSGKKHVTASEARNRPIARKSIVAARPIQKGEILTAENLTTKRPGDGVSPMRWYEVLGTAAVRDFEEDEKIEL